MVTKQCALEAFVLPLWCHEPECHLQCFWYLRIPLGPNQSHVDTSQISQMLHMASVYKVRRQHWSWMLSGDETILQA